MFLAILIEVDGDARNVAVVVGEKVTVLTAQDTDPELLELLHEVRIQSFQKRIDCVHHHLHSGVTKKLLEWTAIFGVFCVFGYHGCPMLSL